MDAELLVEFWETVKEYIPAKDKQTAADHIIINLVDIGLGDEELKELIIFETNKQLNIFSTIYFEKIKSKLNING